MCWRRNFSANVCIKARLASASTISSRRIRPTPLPCVWGAGRTARSPRHRRGTDGRARPGRAHLAFGKNKRHLHDRASAACHRAATGAADHAGCGPGRRDAIEEQTGLVPDLRWPNDLLFGRKKFCGILTEMNAEQDQIHFVAVGIGINVNHERIPEAVVGESPHRCGSKPAASIRGWRSSRGCCGTWTPTTIVS